MAKRLIEAILKSQAEGEKMAMEHERVIHSLMKRAGTFYLGPITMGGQVNGRFRIFREKGDARLRVEQARIIPLPSDLVNPGQIQLTDSVGRQKAQNVPVPVFLGWDLILNHHIRAFVFQALMQETEHPDNNRPKLSEATPEEPEDLH